MAAASSRHSAAVRLVVDASALAAVVFQEPGGAVVAARLDGATVFAPALLKFELANVAWKKARRQPSDAAAILTALERAVGVSGPLLWRDVDHADVVLVAQATGLSTYDASYLWLAGSLGADLVTLDRRLSAVAEA
jgi:predicted nucleic acid-binding protein